MGERYGRNKSWREIDSSRDRARGATPTPERPRAQREADRASRQHRNALEALFARGEVGKLADQMTAKPIERPVVEPAPMLIAPARAPVGKLPVPSDAQSRTGMRKKILDAVGREQVSRAVDKYVELYGLPSDFEVLEQCLEHVRSERIDAALAELERMLEHEKPRRSRALSGKLRFLEETSDDAERRDRAARLRARLG